MFRIPSSPSPPGSNDQGLRAAEGSGGERGKLVILVVAFLVILAVPAVLSVFSGAAEESGKTPASPPPSPGGVKQPIIEIVATPLFPEEEGRKMEYSLFLPEAEHDEGAALVRLVGCEAVADQRGSVVNMTFKEVHVCRARGVVHVFNLQSHGRRMYRRLVFTSDAKFALHCLEPPVASTTSLKSSLLSPTLRPPMAWPSNSRAVTARALSALRSANIPPWTIPNRA